MRERGNVWTSVCACTEKAVFVNGFGVCVCVCVCGGVWGVCVCVEGFGMCEDVCVEEFGC